MIVALLKVMLLGLIRDRGTLAMVFLLPALIFMIFASIFASISGDELRLKVAVLDEVESTLSARLVSALEDEASLRVDEVPFEDEKAMREAVSQGTVDVGLAIRGDLSREETPIVIVVHGGRAMAGSILSGQVQRLVAEKLPGVNLRRVAPEIETLAGEFTPEQDTRLAAALEALDADSETETDDTKALSLVAIETMTPQGANTSVSYYAGAIAMLFVLLSAMQGAATLIEDRNSGIVDRLAVSRAGIDLVVVSKFLFLVGQGIIQVSIIFLVAWIVYGVEFLGSPASWLLVTLSASAAASGLAMMIAAACTTKQQATTISGFLVLLLSAVGGSMVPRFVMPPWLQDIGWYTPNAWAIEAFQRLLWDDVNVVSLAPLIWPLLLLAALGLAIAVALSRVRLRSS